MLAKGYCKFQLILFLCFTQKRIFYDLYFRYNISPYVLNNCTEFFIVLAGLVFISFMAMIVQKTFKLSNSTSYIY